MTDQTKRWTAKIALLGLILVLIYAVVFVLSFRFQLDSEELNHDQKRPILAVLALLGGAFFVYLLACFYTYRAFPTQLNQQLKKSKKSRQIQFWSVFWILLLGTICRFVVVSSDPIQEVDIYRYILDGAMVGAGLDPYALPPEKIAAAADPAKVSNAENKTSPANQEEIRISELFSHRPGLKKALGYVHFQQYTSPYPPVSQAVFAAAMKTVPADANLSRYLVTLKIVIVLFDLATACLLILLLRHLSWPTPLVIVYCWCPLLIKEFANGGHLDSIVVFFVTAAVLATVYALWPHGLDEAAAIDGAEVTETNAQTVSRTWLLFSAILLALSVGAKIFPVILFPLWCVACLKRGGWWVGLIAPVVLVLLTTAIMWPMLRHVNQVQQFGHTLVPQLVAAPTPGRIDSGIEAFAKYWEMNDLLYMVVVENLKPDEVLPCSQRKAWFVVTSNEIRNQVTDRWVERSKQPRQHVAFWITRRVMAGIFLALTLFFCIRFWTKPNSRIWLEMAFLTIAWFWFLSPTQNPWYWTWALPLLVFARSRIWFLVSGITLAYYLRFYFEYHYGQSRVFGTDLAGVQFFDFVVTWLEFLPILILLTGDWVWRLGRRKE